MHSDSVTLRITDLARGGAGVARLDDGRVVFVPMTAPGDRVEARVLPARGRSQKERYVQAELLSVLEPSPLRTEPRCPVFGQCGGCSWQHLDYSLQWQTKVKGVAHALARVEVKLLESLEELPAERIWEYRNRIQLRGFRDQIGFRRGGSHDLVPIQRCEIARPEINGAISAVRDKGRQQDRPYKVEVEILEDGRIRQSWNSAHAAEGFRQVHDEQNEKLKRWVASAVPDGAICLDLFGGTGNLTWSLASRLGAVHCVDVSAPASRPEGTPENYHFHRSAVLPWLVKQTKSRNTVTKPPAGAVSTAYVVAVIDPPREGLGSDFHEVACALDHLAAVAVIAVGCDPDSWARDVSRWCRRGWRLERAAVLDLFPQTPHVESLGLLRR